MEALLDYESMNMEKNNISDVIAQGNKNAPCVQGLIQVYWSVEFVEECYEGQTGKIGWGQILNVFAFQTKKMPSFYKLCPPFMRTETQVGISLSPR